MLDYLFDFEEVSDGGLTISQVLASEMIEGEEKWT